MKLPAELVPKLFLKLCRDNGLPAPQPEYRFAPPRRWRFDWAWPDHLVALEVEGGAWTGGRHTRSSGFLKDMEKYNAAAVAGWTLLRTTPGQLLSGSTIELVLAALNRRSNAGPTELTPRSEAGPITSAKELGANA